MLTAKMTPICLYYRLTYEAKGSGELKMNTSYITFWMVDKFLCTNDFSLPGMDGKHLYLLPAGSPEICTGGMRALT